MNKVSECRVCNRFTVDDQKLIQSWQFGHSLQITIIDCLSRITEFHRFHMREDVNSENPTNERWSWWHNGAVRSTPRSLSTFIVIRHSPPARLDVRHDLPLVADAHQNAAYPAKGDAQDHGEN